MCLAGGNAGILHGSLLMKAIFCRYIGQLLLLVIALFPLHASAGIALNSTRIIYPQDAKQINVAIRNTSDKNTYLVQSWVEDKSGKKTSDFVATPPLYTSGPRNENVLRLMYTGQELPRDRESLYFFNTKSIPSIDKKDLEGKNALIVAAVTRIKLFVRPAGLPMSPDAAPAALTFAREKQQLSITNPTPYYLTLTDLKLGQQKLPDVMVAPLDKALLPLPESKENELSFSTINDYGAVTTPITRRIL